jgi:pimeloyl-ACP methyl ester carboxylesterase
MNPFYFGTDERRLFGIHSERATDTPPKLGVVLCNPFGREAIRAHRLYRVMADRLSRAGCDVLRFDYFGTGDSAGEDGEVDLDGFALDLATAHRELARRAGTGKICWLGMRLGAMVVQRARDSQPAELARTILWDPVFDGRDYLDLLRRRHLEWQTADQDPIGDVAPVFRDDDTAYLHEAIGFPIPSAFCDQVRGHRLANLTPGPDRVNIVCDPGTEEGRSVAALCRQTPGVGLDEAVHGTDWTTEGDATGLVPPKVLAVLLAHAGSVS